jgi:hypothetical protein
MNARALKIGVASQNARRCLIISLTALLLLTLCINTARSATLTWTAIAGGIWSDANNWSPNQVPACGDNIIVPNSGTCAVTDSFTMLPTNDLLCHYRIRTRSRLDTYFQNDFTVTLNYHRLLNSSGIIVAEDDAAQTVIFLNTATARGHPWSGDQSLYLFDNALDRPAPHFCTAPSFSEFQFHDSPSVCNAARLLIQSSLVSRAGTLLVAAISQPKTAKPFTSRSNYEIKM